MKHDWKLVALAVAGVGTFIWSNPLHAQSLAELDRLSDLSATEQGGIAAAQDMAASGALLEALATLERVLAVYPTSLDARILHAYYLCAIDDHQGARVEIENMDEDDFGRGNIDQLRQRCVTASRDVVQSPPAQTTAPARPNSTRPATTPARIPEREDKK